MSADVVDLDVVTRLDIPAERVLRKALEADMQSVVVIGYDSDGEEYFASSLSDGGDALWLIERCKLKLLSVPDQCSTS